MPRVFPATDESRVYGSPRQLSQSSLASPSLAPSCPHPTNRGGHWGREGRLRGPLRGDPQLQALPSLTLASCWSSGQRDPERAHRAGEQRAWDKSIAENREPSVNYAEGQGGWGAEPELKVKVQAPLSPLSGTSFLPQGFSSLSLTSLHHECASLHFSALVPLPQHTAHLSLKPLFSVTVDRWALTCPTLLSPHSPLLALASP